jgi:purine-binding chemotaxis protein CheW
MKTPRKQLDAIDWQALRERLSRASAALEGAHQLSPERAQAILDERAHAAAQAPADTLQAGAMIEVIAFDLGNERYALETNCIREVLRSRAVTPLPGTPDVLVGITNLRGQIVAVFDLRRFFGIAAPSSTEQSRVIVLGKERIEFAILVDAIHEVMLVGVDAIREAPASVGGIAREYLRGVTADAVIVLDGAVLLSDPRLTIDLAQGHAAQSPEVQP